MPLNTIYCSQTPPAPLLDAAHTPAMMRLKQVGMNCGCEYTAFPHFAHCGRYTRWDHGLGVGLVVWHFTGDMTQAMAGLLHDIATPVFAHTIDFLQGDHMKQDSTEARTAELIDSSPEIQAILRNLGLQTADVADYHRYPLADNDLPRLSADRLEYTCGNLLHYGFLPLAEIARLYGDITHGINELGEPELTFRTPGRAVTFAEGALQCGRVYVCPEDRFAMESLANLLNMAMSLGVITRKDLWTTEEQVIDKLTAHPETGEAWAHFRRYSRVISRKDRPEAGLWLQVRAKKRYIDPYVLGRGRVSQLYPRFARMLEEFRQESLEDWLFGM